MIFRCHEKQFRKTFVLAKKIFKIVRGMWRFFETPRAGDYISLAVAPKYLQLFTLKFGCAAFGSVFMRMRVNSFLRSVPLSSRPENTRRVLHADYFRACSA